jgi:hypothetical protein
MSCLGGATVASKDVVVGSDNGSGGGVRYIRLFYFPLVWHIEVIDT